MESAPTLTLFSFIYYQICFMQYASWLISHSCIQLFKFGSDPEEQVDVPVQKYERTETGTFRDLTMTLFFVIRVFKSSLYRTCILSAVNYIFPME